MQFANNLTPAELERLGILEEEMAESLQVIGKIIRHGYHATCPVTGKIYDNRAALQEELGHVRSAMIRLCNAGDLSKEAIHKSAEAKDISIIPWLRHQ